VKLAAREPLADRDEVVDEVAEARCSVGGAQDAGGVHGDRHPPGEWVIEGPAPIAQDANVAAAESPARRPPRIERHRFAVLPGPDRG